jgi:hypothetical protein
VRLAARGPAHHRVQVGVRHRRPHGRHRLVGHPRHHPIHLARAHRPRDQVVVVRQAVGRAEVGRLAVALLAMVLHHALDQRVPHPLVRHAALRRVVGVEALFGSALLVEALLPALLSALLVAALFGSRRCWPALLAEALFPLASLLVESSAQPAPTPSRSARARAHVILWGGSGGRLLVSHRSSLGVGVVGDRGRLQSVPEGASRGKDARWAGHAGPRVHSCALRPSFSRARPHIGLEAGLVVALAAAQRGLSVCQSLLRAQLGHRVNVLILDKALTLSLEQFEDSEFYDRLQRARREASSRPLSLVNRTFALAQNGLSLVTYARAALRVLGLDRAGAGAGGAAGLRGGGALLGRGVSAVLVAGAGDARAGLPGDAGSARGLRQGGEALRPRAAVFERYRAIFERLYGEDRSLTMRRGFWGFALGLVSTAAFYGAYGWIAWAAVAGAITLGGMTMYVMVFKQGQSAFAAMLSSIGGMYEDNLYLSNLYAFLEQPTPALVGRWGAGADAWRTGCASRT